MASKQLLGELLVSQKLISQETLDQALRLQVVGNRRLGHILVRMKAITDDQLATTLANQLGIEITEVHDSFNPEVKKVIPRYLCKQYGVLPLKLKENNVIEVAMGNPSDLEAINDLEHYTGKVIEPRLSRHSDIEKEIPRCIPLGFKDFFSPKVNTVASRVIASIALICVVGLGVYTFDYIQRVREGTVSVSANMILYSNHDLTLAVHKKGSYSLLGHGAFAEGLYKVEFSNLDSLTMFVQRRQTDLSDAQKKWLEWALQQAGEGRAKQLFAQN